MAAALVVAAAAVVFTAWGPTAWLTLVLDGLPVVALLGGALGWGAWPRAWLLPGQRAGGQRACVAIALGLGLVSLLTLALGLSGLLTRVTAWAVVVTGWLAGVLRTWTQRGGGLSTTPLQSQSGSDAPPASTRCLATPVRSRFGWNWDAVAASVYLLPLAVPLAVMLFGACLPPGVLWRDEAFGYDVLEYHLQVPREYFDSGRIDFLPHNVYASFPQQMEMLYLLLMHLTGGALSGAIPAQLLHASCGVLAVTALVAWSPPGWPRRIVALAAGSIPWLAYLGCLAYVELGMLFFAGVAAGLVRDAGFQAGDLRLGGRDWGTTLAAGLCAGSAAGCKYTAVVFVPVCLGLAWLALMPAAVTVRARRIAVFSVGTAMTFSPWLVRNAVLAGNPVYPFAYRWFGGAAWSERQDEQWARGHRVPPERASWAGRAQVIWEELLASRMSGPAIFLAGLAAAVAARSRATLMLALWLVLMIAAWATLTHMPGRFAIPVLVPLAMLVGSDLRTPRTGGPVPILLVGAIVLIGGAANNVTLVRLLHGHNELWTRRGVPLSALPGNTDAFAASGFLNSLLKSAGPVANGPHRAWLVGEARAFYFQPRVHYTVVFNRDPWLEYAAAAPPPAAVDWLRTRNVTYVVFSWDEIARLQRSYGFPAVVTRQWVASLAAAGLRPVKLPPEVDPGRMEVYEVLP